MVQHVADALLDECAHHDCLFWMPLPLCSLMREIGCDRRLGAGPGQGRFLSRLDAIDLVKWGLVDPTGTTVPNHVAHGAPVFVGGCCFV